MREKACEVHSADLISVKWFEKDLCQLSYLAFRTGRHDLYLEREVLPDKIWVKLKLNPEENLVMTPLGVDSWLHLKSVYTIE